MKRLLPVALLLVAIALFAWWWFGTVGAPNPPAVPTAGGSEGHTRSEPPAPGARPATAVQQPDAPPPSNDDQDQDDADHESTELLHEALDEEDFDVVCRIEPALREAEAYLAVGEPDSLDGRRVRVLMGHALVPLLEGPGEGWLSVAGYAPTPVSWGEATPEDPASCEPDPVVLEPGSAAITGVVRHQEGGRPARKAWVEGCGGMSMTDEEGAYFMTVVPGPCRVLALRSDGMLHTRGPAVDVVAREGTDLVVDLEIPASARRAWARRCGRSTRAWSWIGCWRAAPRTTWASRPATSS